MRRYPIRWARPINAAAMENVAGTQTPDPGNFHALPTTGYAMYAPEVRAISDEMRLAIVENAE